MYVSAPLSGADIFTNVHRAIQAAEMLRHVGAVPLVPHTGVLWAMVAPGASYEDFMRLDLALLERSDAVLRLPGESIGADREVAHARELGIPVFEGEDAALLVAAAVRDERRPPEKTLHGDLKRVASRIPESSGGVADESPAKGRQGDLTEVESSTRKAAISHDHGVGADLATDRGMTAAVTAILVDLRDLEAMLHILGDAAESRGDEDSRRALRLLARHAESLEVQVERLGAAGCPAEEETRCKP